MALKHLAGPTGGLSYHWIARKRVNHAWRPFRAQVRDWLLAWKSQWPETCSELIVFGPSAGWTLPLTDLAKINKLVFVEPDPIARFLLRRRLKYASLEFYSRADLLPWFSDDLLAFNDFLRDRPKAAVLFSNLLGQVPLLVSPSYHASQNQHAQDAFLSALKGRTWASYHDIFSTQTAKGARLTTNAIPSFGAHEASTRLSEIAVETFEGAGTLTDHETSWLSVGRRTEFALWPLTEKQVHLIGFVKQP
jgi:hypothetical protein